MKILTNIWSFLLIISLISNNALGQSEKVFNSNSVIDEIREVLEGYRIAMLTRDYDTMINFWSDSEDFVFAGDGRILGGFDAWKVETTGHYESTKSWERWDWQDVNILPLSNSAATATLEFRFRWVDNNGVTHNSRGAWTYVFRKEDGEWKVIQTNGTHLEI